MRAHWSLAKPVGPGDTERQRAQPGPKEREGDNSLNDALADEAIAFVRSGQSVTWDRPFFIYCVPGATHAPRYVPEGLAEPVRPGLGPVRYTSSLPL